MFEPAKLKKCVGGGNRFRPYVGKRYGQIQLYVSDVELLFLKRLVVEGVAFSVSDLIRLALKDFCLKVQK